MHQIDGRNLDFSYPGKVILSGASIKVNSAEITGLLGSNGSGKTTFFDLVCGVKTVQHGDLTLNTRSLLYLSQTVAASPVLRMKDIFKLILAFTKNEKLEIEAILEKLGTWSPELVHRYTDLWQKKSAICSYGEARWFFTTSLLAIPADLVILDEPTAGVDPECRHYIWECIKAAAQEGTAILVASHSVEEIVQHTDQFYMLANQKFTRFSTAQEYLTYYQAQTLDAAFIQANKRFR